MEWDAVTNQFRIPTTSTIWSMATCINHMGTIVMTMGL
jgi:hypothetical protein